MPVRVGTESAPCSPAVIPAGSAAAGSTTVNSGWRARNAAICCWFSAGSMVQVEYTSLPPAFSSCAAVSRMADCVANNSASRAGSSFL